MIVQSYTDTEDREVIFLRYRDHDGLVQGSTEFRPYFYARADDLSREHVHEAFDSRFDGWSQGERVGRTLPSEEMPEGEEVVQVMAPSSRDIRAMREIVGDSWEADVRYEDRFCIDNISPDEWPEWGHRVVRAGGFDMEWNQDDEITAMGFTTNGVDVEQFAWHPIHGTIHNEKDMLVAFAERFRELDPDLVTTWAGNRADWPMVYRRYRHHGLSLDWCSPIENTSTPPMKHLPRSGFYMDGEQMLLGRMTLDLADRNHGFERVWRDGGNGLISDRRLGSVGKMLWPDQPELWKVDMGGLTHHELWMNHWEDFLTYHRGDILLTDRIDQSYHVSRFFMALQRVCGVSFSSVFTVSRFARGLLRRRATWVAPTGNYKSEKKSYAGGFVSPPVPGRHHNVGVFDYRAMYAEIQRADNISPETIRFSDEGNVRFVKNGTYWSQDAVGVLPRLQMDLADARNQAKAEMKKHAPGSSEYAGFNTLQLAFKRAAASVYGLMGTTGNGEAHRAVAETITFVGRSLVDRLMQVCDEMGYQPLAGHTDSAYISIGDADGHAIANELTARVQKEFDSERFVVEFEKFMSCWVAAKKKNRNFGWVVWPKEALHCTGFEFKKSNASQITKDVQENAFLALTRDGADQETIDEIVFAAIRSVRDGTRPITDFVMRSRLSADPERYEKAGGFQLAAKRYNATADWKFRSGDSVPHVYSTSGITAFRDESELDSIRLNPTTTIEKQVISPIVLIYEAMGWAKPSADASRPQRLW